MINSVAVLSVHTGPLDALGGKDTGGMNVYVRELTRALGKRGIATDIFTRAQHPAAPRIQRIGECGRVFRVPAGPQTPYDKNKVYDHLAPFTQGILDIAEQQRIHYDVVHGHYWLSGLAARILGDVWQVPVVQMFHTLGKLKNQVASSAAEMESALRIEQEGEVMCSADLLVAATALEKNQMQTLYGADPAKIAVVPPGVNLERFRPLPCVEARAHIGIPPHQKMVLFVGRIQPIKGIDTLIRAMALLFRDKPELADQVCLCIIGGSQEDSASEQQELARLKTLQHELGVGNLITFLGSKEQAELVYYYSGASVLVVPSHYESFGMVALEAMACGTPIIASDVGGLSYSVADNFSGYLVPRGDPKLLADKIDLVLDQDDLRRQLGEQAKQWVRRYSWTQIAEEILTVYERATMNVTQRSLVLCP
jgi:D-inositol-3-phosphate glycosyltransferase